MPVVSFQAVDCLDDALALLDDEAVDEVIVQSGQPLRTLHGFKERAVPGNALTASEIVGMLQAAQLAHIVPRHDTAGEEHITTIGDRSYRLRIARFLDLIELRLSIDLADEAHSGKAAAASKHRREEVTVMVTAPKGPPRATAQAQSAAAARRLARVQLKADPMPAPTRHPIGSEDPTIPITAVPSGRREDSGLHLLGHGLPGERRREPSIDLPPDDQTGRGSTTPPAAGNATRREIPLDSVTSAPPPTGAAGEPENDPETRRRHRPANGVPVPPEPSRSAPPPPADAPPRHRPAAAAQPAAPKPTAFIIALEPDSKEVLGDTLAIVLASARERGASDVHFTSDEPVRVRIAGKLAPEGGPLAAADLRAAVDALLSPERREALQTRGYADLGLTDLRAGRLRINVCRHRTGVKLCARLVAPGPASPSDLGLPWEVEAIANHHQGLVICSGPSGMGKTTTMAALIQLFNERKAVHIITVEDPVEIRYPIGKAVVSQREVGTHTQSFASALKGSLREDPDIIGIGEMRDAETVAMALSAAETGHLVLATMSTPSGAETIDRLIDMFPPDDQNQVRATLAGALKLVVSQRLIESIDGTRQVAAFEVITGNVPLWSLIRDRKLVQLPSLLQRGRAYGMVRLEDSLRALMLSKAISRQAAIANASDPKLLGVDEGPDSAPASQRARAGNP